MPSHCPDRVTILRCFVGKDILHVRVYREKDQAVESGLQFVKANCDQTRVDPADAPKINPLNCSGKLFDYRSFYVEEVSI